MPNIENNDKIAHTIIDLGWFESQTREGTPSDNWRFVQVPGGQSAIVYLELYHSTSQGGEPQQLPNNKDTVDGEGTLPKLVRLHRELSHPKTGPFLVLAEIWPNGKIGSIRCWNAAGKLEDGVKSISLLDLGKPDRSHPSMAGGS